MKSSVLSYTIHNGNHRNVNRIDIVIKDYKWINKNKKWIFIDIVVSSNEVMPTNVYDK